MDKVLPEAQNSVQNVFPCETKWSEKGKEGETKHCPHMHSNLSGYCEQCTRESSLLPPGLEKRVRRAGRQESRARAAQELQRCVARQQQDPSAARQLGRRHPALRPMLAEYRQALAACPAMHADAARAERWLAALAAGKG